MHVLVVAVSASTSPSGVCRLAANLAHGMLLYPRVQKITILTGAWQERYFRNAFNLKGERLEIRSVEISNSAPSRNLWHLCSLPALARDLHADVVHLTFPVPVLRVMFSAPIILTLHDLYPFDMPENFGRRAWLNRTALRLCLRNVDAVACISRTTRLRLQEIFPKLKQERCSVVMNSVWPRPAQGHVLLPGELRGHPFLLCVAQHRANKNLRLLLRAFHRARQQEDLGPKTKLVIAGSYGPETGPLQRMVEELGLKEHVVFLHNLTDAMLYVLYRDCELLVAPSLTEGFGAPVAEALAAGRRVVCSDIPAHREIGGNVCFYFDPLEASGNALLGALHQARFTGDRGAAPAARMPEQLAAEYYSLYEKLLKQNKTKTSAVHEKAPASSGGL